MKKQIPDFEHGEWVRVKAVDGISRLPWTFPDTCWRSCLPGFMVGRGSGE